MHNNTIKKIAFLQAHVAKNLTKWLKKYGDNITGVRIDKKRKAKKAKPYYSIVFNVIKKIDEKDLPKNKIIPKHIEILDADGTTKKIKTDVRQTGEFKFHTGIMDVIQDGQNGNPGTLGLLLKDNHENIFGLTNYHVAAASFLQNDILSYDVTAGSPAHNVLVSGNTCRLHIGKFNRDMDMALVFLGNNIPVSNSLPDGRQVNRDVFIDGPLPTTVRNKIVFLYLPSRSLRVRRPIEDNQAPLNTSQIQFRELVTVNRCSTGGDSGSLVIGDDNMVLGIVLGADDEFTYIVPYYKIFNHFPLRIV